MMTREQKRQEISNLSEKFGKAQAAFLVDFKGLNVEKVTELRKKLSDLHSEMKVVRNTLAKLAIKDHPGTDEALREHFIGTNAVVFSYEDASASAKALKEFGEKAEELVIKTGVLEGKSLDVNAIKALADLPSKEVLQAQFLGLLQAPMAKFVRTLNEVPSGFARVLAAYKDKQAG